MKKKKKQFSLLFPLKYLIVVHRDSYSKHWSLNRYYKSALYSSEFKLYKPNKNLKEYIFVCAHTKQKAHKVLEHDLVSHQLPSLNGRID